MNEKRGYPYLVNQDWVAVHWHDEMRGSVNFLVGVIHKDDVEDFKNDKNSMMHTTIEEYRDCLRDFVFKKGRGFLKEDYSPKPFPKLFTKVTKSLLGKKVVIRDCTYSNGKIATVINEDLVGGKLQLRLEDGGEYWCYKKQVRVVPDKDIEPICGGMTVRFILHSCKDRKVKEWIQYEIAFGTMKETDPVDVALANIIRYAHGLTDDIYKMADKASKDRNER